MIGLVDVPSAKSSDPGNTSSFGMFRSGLISKIICVPGCNVSFEFDKFKFPEYNLPSGKSEAVFIRELVYDGLEKKYGSPLEDKITQRADYELDIINKMGYNGYFIIVWDFIKYAKDKRGMQKSRRPKATAFEGARVNRKCGSPSAAAQKYPVIRG